VVKCFSHGHHKEKQKTKHGTFFCNKHSKSQTGLCRFRVHERTETDQQTKTKQSKAEGRVPSAGLEAGTWWRPQPRVGLGRAAVVQPCLGRGCTEAAVCSFCPVMSLQLRLLRMPRTTAGWNRRLSRCFLALGCLVSSDELGSLTFNCF